MKYLLILLVLCACNPLKHYQRVANDPFRNEQERKLLAKASLEEFPPQAVGEPTIRVVVDSTEINRLNEEYNKLVDDYVRHIEADTSKFLDTVFLTKIRNLKPATITRTVTIEKEVRSTAVENQLQTKINECDRENQTLATQAKKAKDEKKKARSTMAFLWIISGLLLAGHVVPLFRKIT